MNQILKLNVLTKTLLFCSFFFSTEATLYVPIAYTRPTGLQSVNGSDALGGCPQTPLNCVVSEGGIDVCRCPGGTPATGVLIDGVIQAINPGSENWADELFTVNRNGQSSIVIGFLFPSPYTLRKVEMKLFNCPPWNIGASTINVYGSLVFPTFISSTAVGSVNIATTLSCSSLTTVTIPVELTTSARSIYHIEMTFNEVLNVLWSPAIAEIEFSDETPTESPQRPTGATTATTAMTTTLPSTDEPNTLSGNMTETIATQELTTKFSSTKPQGTDTTETNEVTSSELPSTNNTSTIIGALVAIIVLLFVLIIISVLALFGFQVLRSKKRNHLKLDQNPALEQHPQEQSVCYSTVKDTDTADNQYYEDVEATGYSATRMKDDELYTVIRDERSGSRDGLNTVGNGLYHDDIEGEQTIRYNRPAPKLETVQQPNEAHSYAKVEKTPPPPVPQKTPELHRDLQIEKEEGMMTATDPPFVIISEYTDVGREGEPEDKGIYSEVGNDSQLPNSPSGLMLLSKSLCDEMDENPDYESSGSAMLFAGMAKRSQEGGASNEVYGNPDTSLSKEEIYATVYSEPIQPSLFDSKALDSNDTSEEIQLYTPVYTFSGLPALSDDMLCVSHDNILEIGDLGTGAFGNVLLAQTRGLSRKDLKLSETDDDKTVTLQVAIKTLKRNPTEKQKQAFEKEQRFTARLSHPNVICMLAVCNEDDPFIMMEYMDNGDLNQYLQRFTSISGKSVPSDSEIETNTLLYMATQVASAMVYLTSKNYVHRDLATRNCLVDQQFLVKLGDFGMSRNLYESHYYIVHGRVILPIRWMATECFYGKFSPKSDVWAFGVTVWEIFSLAKEQPYSEMGDREIAQDALKKEKRTLLENPPNCPQEVYDIMRKCWASDPKERATFEELHEALTSLDSDFV